MNDLITPEAIHFNQPGYAPGHWDYPRRCADVDLALAEARTRVEEWDSADAHGWWHERPNWIALHNEVVRRRLTKPRINLEAMNGETLRDWLFREQRIARHEYSQTTGGSIEAAFFMGVLDVLKEVISLSAGTGINRISD